nr:1292_t:CDS:2 [Entrophospora candida]
MNLVNDNNAKRKMSSSSSENLPTTATLDCLLTNIEILSPLNLTPLTNFIRQEVISHVSTFENRCNKNWLFSGLVKLGISRFYLFILLIIFTGLTVKNMYNRSLYLLCNLIGVVYPTYRSMKIIVSSFSSTTDKEKKQWLTYWTIYGWLQIADYWSESLLKLFPGYNIFKLLFLYWAQNDRFKGATVIFESIIKPLINKKSFTTINNINNQRSSSSSDEILEQSYNNNNHHNNNNKSSSLKISNASITTTSLKNELNTEDIWKKDIAMYETTNVRPYRVNIV